LSFGTAVPPTPQPELDTTPPTISDPQAIGINLTLATIAWKTDELSDSQVEYGLTSAYGLTTVLDSLAVTSHSVLLSNLQSNTQYFYRVKSRDAAGNQAVSENNTFTTATPSVPGVITDDTITLRAPDGGDVWIRGFKGSVFWDADVYNPVTINLLKGGVFYRTLVPYELAVSFYITEDVYYPRPTRHAWVEIPLDVPEGTDYTLEILDTTNLQIRDVSNAQFRIITLPDPVTVHGRIVDRFTQVPLANISILSDSDPVTGRRTFSTDVNGEFSFSVPTGDLAENKSKNLFATWPACYKAQGSGLSRSFVMMNASLGEFDLVYDSKHFPFISPEIDLGTISLWPAVTLNISSDIPVRFWVAYPEEKSASGGSLYKTSHTLSNVIPLDYNIRVEVIDESGNSYFSPYIKLGLDHGCSDVTLKYFNGQFQWEYE